jgi:hypothetical protein
MQRKNKQLYSGIGLCLLSAILPRRLEMMPLGAEIAGSGVAVMLIAVGMMGGFSRSWAKVRRQSARPEFLVSVEKQPVQSGTPPRGQERALFWQIKVKNGKTPIDRCYAQIEEFHWVNEDDGHLVDLALEPWPKPGHELPWSRSSGGQFEKPLGSNEIAYVDYAMSPTSKTKLFTVPTHPDSPNLRPSYGAFRLPIGIYQIVISVSSRETEIKKKMVRFRFHFNGGYSKIEELPPN